MALKSMLIASVAAVALLIPAMAGAESLLENNCTVGMDGGAICFVGTTWAPETFPESTARRYAAATQALQAGDYATATRLAGKMVQRAPDDLRAVQLLGAAQLGDQQWKAAQKTYAQALRATPGDAVLRAGHGVSLARLGDPKAGRELAWLSAKAEACGAACPEAARLKALTSEVQRAMGGA